MEFAVNNNQTITMEQKSHDGPILVQTKESTGHVNTEYNISAGDMVTMLNWYRHQKARGNENLMF